MPPTYLTTPSLGAYDGYVDATDYGVQGFPPAMAEAKGIIHLLEGLGVFGPGKTVLDLGCGPGFLLRETMAISPSSHDNPHFGLDESQRMVLNAMRYLHPSSADATATPPKVRQADIRNHSDVRAALRQQGSNKFHRFDLIICSNVLTHVDPRTHRELIASWCEYLKPGGYILVSRPYYADVSRGRILNSTQTHTHAPIPGAVLLFDVGPEARTVPQAASAIVPLAGSRAQDASDNQLRGLIASVAVPWGASDPAGQRVRIFGGSVIDGPVMPGVGARQSVMGIVREAVRKNASFAARVNHVGGLADDPDDWERDWPILQCCLTGLGLTETTYFQSCVYRVLLAEGTMPNITGKVAAMTMAVSSTALLKGPN